MPGEPKSKRGDRLTASASAIESYRAPASRFYFISSHFHSLYLRIRPARCRLFFFCSSLLLLLLMVATDAIGPALGYFFRAPALSRNLCDSVLLFIHFYFHIFFLGAARWSNICCILHWESKDGLA